MQGAYSRAEVLYWAGQARFLDFGDESGAADVQRALGALAVARTGWAKARDLFGASLQYAQEHETKQEIAQCLEGIAGTLSRNNTEAAEHDAATRLYGAAAAVRAAIGVPLHNCRTDRESFRVVGVSWPKRAVSHAQKYCSIVDASRNIAYERTLR